MAHDASGLHQIAGDVERVERIAQVLDRAFVVHHVEVPEQRGRRALSAEVESRRSGGAVHVEA